MELESRGDVRSRSRTIADDFHFRSPYTHSTVNAPKSSSSQVPGQRDLGSLTPGYIGQHPGSSAFEKTGSEKTDILNGLYLEPDSTDGFPYTMPVMSHDIDSSQDLPTLETICQAHGTSSFPTSSREEMQAGGRLQRGTQCLRASGTGIAVSAEPDSASEVTIITSQRKRKRGVPKARGNLSKVNSVRKGRACIRCQVMHEEVSGGL